MLKTFGTTLRSTTQENYINLNKKILCHLWEFSWMWLKFRSEERFRLIMTYEFLKEILSFQWKLYTAYMAINMFPFVISFSNAPGFQCSLVFLAVYSTFLVLSMKYSQFCYILLTIGLEISEACSKSWGFSALSLNTSFINGGDNPLQNLRISTCKPLNVSNVNWDRTVFIHNSVKDDSV